MPVNNSNIADYLEWLARTDIPLQDARLQRDIRAYLAEEFKGTQVGDRSTKAQLRALQYAAQVATGIAKAQGLEQVIRTLSPTRTDIRWVIPGLRGLFGTQTLIQRARQTLAQ